MYEYETITERVEKVNEEDLNNSLKELSGKKFFIAGAGTIGTALAKKLANYDIHLYIADMHEEQLAYLKDYFDSIRYNKYTLFLADLKIEKYVSDIFSTYDDIDYIINTAAYKHVVFCEDNAEIAFDNNISVTQNLLKQKPKRLNILISSDKAVDPINTMGMTKRTCELLYLKSDNTKIIRFGNVYASSGSLVPRVARGIDLGVVKITGEHTKRYFMTMNEAVYLIIKAINSNKVLNILDMGEQLNIKKIIEKMVLVSGKKVQINNIGMLPGEKIEEKLTYDKLITIDQIREELNKYNDPLLYFTNLDKFDWDVLE